MFIGDTDTTIKDYLCLTRDQVSQCLKTQPDFAGSNRKSWMQIAMLNRTGCVRGWREPLRGFAPNLAVNHVPSPSAGRA